MCLGSPLPQAAASGPFRCVPDDRGVQSCFDTMNSTGFCVLENAVTRAAINDCRDAVDQLVEKHGQKYFSLIQPYNEPGSGFHPLVSDPNFVGLLRALSERAAGPSSVDGFELYNVLRVIAGPDGASNSLRFHYDATVVTALVPLYIPDGPPEEAGDLVAAPNLRKIRRYAVLNVLEKLILQNPLAYKIEAKLLLRKPNNEAVVRLVPGNVYLFWGYRTLHANLPVRSGEKRATLLLHFGDPHAHSLLTRQVLRIRKMRQIREVR